MFLKQWICIAKFPFENIFKRTKNCSFTRAKMNEPRLRRELALSLLCDVRYGTIDNSHENFSFIVT